MESHVVQKTLMHKIMFSCLTESGPNQVNGTNTLPKPRPVEMMLYYTTYSLQEQRSVLMLKATREMKYEYLQLKYLFIDKMWIFPIFRIINPPSGKWVKKLGDIFTASTWVWGCLIIIIQAHICRPQPSQSKSLSQKVTIPAQNTRCPIPFPLG